MTEGKVTSWGNLNFAEWAKFADQQADTLHKLAAVEETVKLVTNTHPELRGHFGGSLFVIIRDPQSKIFVAETDTKHPNRPGINIRSYWTYRESFGSHYRKSAPTATEVIDYAQEDPHQQTIVCDGAIINELVETNLVMQVRKSEFVLHRPYGLVRVYASMIPSKQVANVDWDKYFGARKSAYVNSISGSIVLC